MTKLSSKKQKEDLLLQQDLLLFFAKKYPKKRPVDVYKECKTKNTKYKNICNNAQDDYLNKCTFTDTILTKMSETELRNFKKKINQIINSLDVCSSNRQKFTNECVEPQRRDKGHSNAIRYVDKLSSICKNQYKKITTKLDEKQYEKIIKQLKNKA
jgi:hypothetical protein